MRRRFDRQLYAVEHRHDVRSRPDDHGALARDHRARRMVPHRALVQGPNRPEGSALRGRCVGQLDGRRDQAPPVAPVLVDGLYPHTAASITTPKAYSYDLKLPNTPCTRCTLQLVQFMNHHPYNMPGGYFYHHCADISIQLGADGGAETVELDAGEGSSSSGGNGATSSSGSGGSNGGAAASASGASSGGASTAAGGSADEGGAGETPGGGAPAQSAAQGSSGGGSRFPDGRATAAVGSGSLLAVAALFARRRRREE